MGAELAAAGLSALASLGSTAINNQLAAERASDDKVYQIGVIKQGQNWQEKMLDRMNWYSSPSSAKARYQEAGFNPYLASGSMGTGIGQNSATPPNSAGAPSVAVQPRDYSLGPSMAQLGVALGNQNIEKQKMMLDMYPKIREYFGKDAARQWSVVNGLPYGDNAEMFTKMDMESDLLDAKRAHEDAQRYFLNTMGYAEGHARISEMNEHIAKMKEEINVLKSQGKLNEQSAFELGTRMARNMAEAGLFRASAKYQNLQTSIGNASAQYVISALQDESMLRSLEYLNASYDWNVNRSRRNFFLSDEGQKHLYFNSTMTPEGNYVISLLNGFSSSLPKLGINYKSPINLNGYGSYNYNR